MTFWCSTDNILGSAFQEFVDPGSKDGCIMCQSSPALSFSARCIVVDENMKVLNMEEKPQGF